MGGQQDAFLLKKKLFIIECHLSCMYDIVKMLQKGVYTGIMEKDENKVE